MKQIVSLSVRLALFVAVVTAMLSWVNILTRDIIAQRRAAEGEAARSSLMSGTFVQLDSEIPEEFSDEITAAYRAEKDGVFVGYCFDVTVKGYNEIQMIVGVFADGSVAGVKILAQTETPGIGSKVVDESGAYLPQFVNLPSSGIDSVVAISGATLSSEGVRDGVRVAAAYAAALSESEVE